MASSPLSFGDLGGVAAGVVSTFELNEDEAGWNDDLKSYIRAAKRPNVRSMPEAPLVTDPPPPALQAELDALSVALDEQIPSKQLDRNLLIGTWNLREFGALTKKWQSEEGDSPKRDLFSVRVIAAWLI
jgi:hypothetical protein